MSKHRRAQGRPAPTAMWQCQALPLWVRVGLYAQAHHGVDLAPGELRRALDPHVARPALSRAISRAVAEGLVAHDSTARCLWSLVRSGT